MRADYDILLFHSTADRQAVGPLSLALEQLDLDVSRAEHALNDEDGGYASHSAAIDAFEFVAICVSKKATVARWIEREIVGSLADQIRRRTGRILCVVVLDDGPVPPLLAGIPRIDLAHSSPAEAAAEINRAIMTARTTVTVNGYMGHLRERLDTALGLIEDVRIAPGFSWTIISGASSAGKDALSAVVLHQLQPSYGLAFLRKFTTRDRRQYEPDYVKELSEEDFARRKETGEIMFDFWKRGVRYGFDGKQFRAALREGSALIAVFTEFELVPPVVDALNSRGARTAAFLVQANRDDLQRRTLFRPFDSEEVQERLKSIDQDYVTMKQRASLTDEYVFVENGDDTAFNTAATELVEGVRSVIEGRGGALYPA